ncbi:MAG TPA: hypothetical protein VLM37_04860 [Fibrobacteraceae bacterium]|nr:hypothetical protein [Fibrobacteraceae bacterium]
MKKSAWENSLVDGLESSRNSRFVLSFLVFVAWFVLVLGACSSAPKSDATTDDMINDALISFTVNTQAARYSDALELLTYEEQLELIDGGGNIKPEYKAAMKRIKLSALQKYPFTLDSKGRLVGMLAVLKDANRKFLISDEQRSLTLDQVEKDRKAHLSSSVPASSSSKEVEDFSSDEEPDESSVEEKEAPSSENLEEIDDLSEEKASIEDIQDEAGSEEPLDNEDESGSEEASDNGDDSGSEAPSGDDVENLP